MVVWKVAMKADSMAVYLVEYSAGNWDVHSAA